VASRPPAADVIVEQVRAACLTLRLTATVAAAAFLSRNATTDLLSCWEGATRLVATESVAAELAGGAAVRRRATAAAGLPRATTDLIQSVAAAGAPRGTAFASAAVLVATHGAPLRGTAAELAGAADFAAAAVLVATDIIDGAAGMVATDVAAAAGLMATGLIAGAAERLIDATGVAGTALGGPAATHAAAQRGAVGAAVVEAVARTALDILGAGGAVGPQRALADMVATGGAG
jgi:hypothetical protein